MNFKLDYESLIGKLYLISNEIALTNIYFDKDIIKNEIYSNTSNEHLILAKTWLDNYFSHQNTEKIQLAIDIDCTRFQKIVFEEVNKIKYGQTITYKQLAQKVGKILNKPKMSCQAIGQALKRNPIPIIIPCHRVVGTNDLGGYNKGIEIKKALLAFEKEGIK